MNVLGIIAEYNPFHNGHKYLINEAKKRINADYVIVIMSGSFTEQGNIAIFNKFDRANSALYNGADLVIELPTIFATSSSENFAKGAINILNSLGIVTHIAFGSECSSIELLQEISLKILNNSNNVSANIKKYLKEGLSFPLARDKSLKTILEVKEYAELSKPNNILAIEYIKNLIVLKSLIKPILIHRGACLHGDENIDYLGSFASSTSIRNEIKQNSNYIEAIQKYVPKNTLPIFVKNTPKNNNDFFELLKYQILKLGKDNIKNIRDVSEGLENRIYDMALKSNTYDEYILNVKSKRYTLARIKRICINILLDITKKLNDDLSYNYYARILKIKKDSKKILPLLMKNTTIPIITSLKDTDIKNLNKKTKESLNLDILATNISELNRKNLNMDYINYIF